MPGEGGDKGEPVEGIGDELFSDSGEPAEGVADAALDEKQPEHVPDAIDVILEDESVDRGRRDLERAQAEGHARGLKGLLEEHRRGAIAFAAGTLLAVSVLGGIWAASSDDGDAAIQQAPASDFGGYWELNASNTLGYRTGTNAREYPGGLYLLLESEDGVSDDGILRFRIVEGTIEYPEVNISTPAGCTYTSSRIEEKVDGSDFFDGAQVGFLEFDLNADPLTYAGFVSSNTVHRVVTHECEGGSSVTTVFEGSVHWVDQQKHVPIPPGISDSSFTGLSEDPADEGFVDLAWQFVQCGQPGDWCTIDRP